MPFGSEPREEGSALALSGGGYRAVLFHCGTLIRLNELGVLGQLKRVSSVSGGSITAGVLATRWSKLTFQNGTAANLYKEVIEPLRKFCSDTVDVSSIFAGALNPFKTAGDYVIDAYRKKLGLHIKLTDLPDTGPRFVFNSTNFATGVSFRFSKPYCGDYHIGLIRNHSFDVATAVGCSSAFPPVLSPIELNVDPTLFTRTDHADLYDQVDLRTHLSLADGGVYDNMGLETVWGRFSEVLASDAGKPFEIDSKFSALWPKQLQRVMNIGLNQALALRKRMLINAFIAKECSGAYWGIGTPIARYGLASSLSVPEEKTLALSKVRTRLDAFSEREQGELINWGYAIADAAIRAHLPRFAGQSKPSAVPVPQFPIGN